MDYPVLTPQQLAVHLRSLRKARNLTQAELGAKPGINQARIGKIERDPRSVSIGQFMQILALLGARIVLQTSSPPKTPPAAETTEW
jgi:HTH-type transcriptional regulator / antitoxin HipB